MTKEGFENQEMQCSEPKHSAWDVCEWIADVDQLVEIISLSVGLSQDRGSDIDEG